MKILLVQHRAIGDVLMCTPAIRTLRRAKPNAEITFLVADFAFECLRNNPYIDQFITPSQSASHIQYMKYILHVIKNKYDVVIDFQNNPRSALITAFSMAKKRISFESKHRNYAYNILIKPPPIHVYAGLRKLMLLRPLGVEEKDDCIPDFYISEDDKKWAESLWDKLGFSEKDFVVVVSPVSGGKKRYRQWSLKNYAQLCDLLISKYGARLLFNWGPGEFPMLKSVLEQMNIKIEVNYEIPSIRFLKAALERASLFIGNDGGARHVAVTADIPTVGIYHNPKVSPHWTPPGDPKHVVVQPETPGIGNVHLDTVIEKVNTMVESLFKSNVLCALQRE